MSKTFTSLLAAVEAAAAQRDAHATEAAVHELVFACILNKAVPDEAVHGILAACSEPELCASQAAAHMLNFFEFESPRLTLSQKKEVLAFLKRCGSTFTHVHTQQVVTELVHGEYLR